MTALKTRLRSRPQDQAGGANRAVTLYARARLIGTLSRKGGVTFDNNSNHSTTVVFYFGPFVGAKFNPW